MTAQEATIAAALTAFATSECADVPAIERNIVATVGTLAPPQPSDKLQAVLTRAGITLERYTPYQQLGAFVDDTAWTLGMVWSPFKRDAVALCTTLTLSADHTQVVDTIIRNGAQWVGINTNTFAAPAAIRHLLGTHNPARTLILGTGASARSVAAGLQREIPTEIGVIGRSKSSVKALIADTGTGEPVTDVKQFAPDLVVNATTVGEDADGTLDFDISAALNPGVYFYDLNQHCSNLQRDALSAGCNVQSGALMQRITHALRVSLLSATS